ncbi:MAG TPA: terminase small subunit [Chitinophagaceae bacterium]|nr:terminase small subunit [Chitinophagaceae bacterium]
MAYKLQPAGVQAKWAEYRKECDENIATVRYRDKLVQVPKKIIYSLEGFCLFWDLSEDDLKKYEGNKNYRAVFKKIRYQVMCRKMEALVNGEGNTRGLIFDLKVNHGIDPKQVREETDWKVTLNLNHDKSESESGSLEDRKSGSEERSKSESREDRKSGREEGCKSGSPGDWKSGSEEGYKSESREDRKSGREEGKEPESALVERTTVENPAPELPPEVKTAATEKPPVIPGVRPGLVPTGGVLPYGTPPKLNYEPEYKPERSRYSRW